MKKSVRLVAVLMCVLFVLSACSNGSAATTTTAAATSTPATQSGAQTTAPAAEATAAPEDTGNFNPTGYPIVKEKITLTGFGNQNVTHADWNDLWCFTSYEEFSNIHVEWETAPNSGFNEAKSILLASGDYPDMFYRCAFSVSELVTYGSQGVFAVLNDYIDQYAPNLLNVFEIEASARKEMTMADGNIYSMPMVNVAASSGAPRGWINGRWLKNVGKEVPTTIDEIYDVLVAFKENDANGNGDPSDELVYSDRIEGKSITQWTRSAFGMGNLGVNMANVYFCDSVVDGELRFFANSDAYKQQLAWINSLFKAGVIDQEMFTQDIPTFTAKGGQDLIGAFFQNDNPQIIGSLNTEFVYVAPPKNIEDGQVYAYNYGPVSNVGVFAVNAASEYIKEAVRWCDYWYGEEGQIRIRLGIEGVTYTVQPDGSFLVTEYVNKNPDGLTSPQAMGKYAIGFAGGGCPEYVTNRIEIARLPKDTFDAYYLEQEYVQLKDRVALRFTTEEQDELNAMLNDLTTYIDENAVAFITGTKSLDTDWDAYCKTINQMGLARYMEILGASYDRWLSL